MSALTLLTDKYDPAGKEITSKTPLGPGITIAKFLGARGSRTTLKKLYNESFDGPPDFQQIARNLILHANILQSLYGIEEFAQHRLTVSEGIYEPNPLFDESGNYVGERPSGVLEKRRTGQAVVYQLIDKNGKTDHAKTFDLAVYWKDFIDYDMLTLDYDTYDISGELTSQIVIETPKVPENYVVKYEYDIQTLFNGQLQTANELLEIIDGKSEEAGLVKTVTRAVSNLANEAQEDINNLFGIDLDII